MKKIISLLLVLVLCVGILSTAAFAEEEMYDVIVFENVKSKKSDNGLFTLTAIEVDEDGWWCGSAGYFNEPLTITAADGLMITRIEAEIGYFPDNYDGIAVSGSAIKQPLTEKNGVKIAPITNINSLAFSVTGGTKLIQFKTITVYYTTHTHSFGDDGKCSCGLTGCEFNAHNYQLVTVYKCQVCGEEAPEGYVPEVPGGSTGSTLSQGNMTIVVGVACAAVFGFGGFLLGRKKKPAVASGANSENEE